MAERLTEERETESLVRSIERATRVAQEQRGPRELLPPHIMDMLTSITTVRHSLAQVLFLSVFTLIVLFFSFVSAA